MTDRRTFLAMTGGALALTLLSPHPALAGHDCAGDPLLASCVRTDDDRFAVVVVDAAGCIRAMHPLPDRGHDVAFDPAAGLCVAFARRPGTFAVAFDLAGRVSPTVIASAPGRHFYGHGVFSADGGLLYATENDVASGEGCVGVYDVRDGWRRVGAFPTGGIGPHELVWCADGTSLAIANGGLETDPAFGRRNLNVADMRSSLAVVDAATGRLIASANAGAGLERLSIRHLAVDHGGAVWFGCQSEGDRTGTPPLVGRLDTGGGVEMLALPEEIRHRPRNYIGSVAVSSDGGTVMLSAPRGGVLMAFDAITRRFRGTVDLRDGCGLAPAGSGLMATSGNGRMLAVDTAAPDIATRDAGRLAVAFDNHLARLA